ncbi:phosphotransferase [Streptomyces sp. NPDC006670]|uniref:protein kinase domain-containing protein n=1 Tax=Streptomyces sp. NPDC006670 TaxID=3154476 RepID=UPI003402F2E1
MVYLAQGPDGGLVALKRLREELAADPEFRARFRREATAPLRVQGTPARYGAGRRGRRELPVRGHGVRTGTDAGGARRRRHGARLRRRPRRGARAIHRCGLVHRDLKPGNVLLSDQGPKVIDFGIAQAADATAPTRTGVTLGTVSRRPTCSPGR